MAESAPVRTPLTRDAILGQAVEMIDAEGVQKLSMRRLGDALGVEAMALYHHFANKDAILDALVERLVAEANPQMPAPGADWKETMSAGIDAVNQALRAHPRAAPLFIGRHYRTETSLNWLEGPLAILHSAGFRGQELVDATHAVLAYVAGWFTLAAGEGGTWSGPADEDLARAPHAAPLATANAAGLRDWGRGFDEGLRALLDGLGTRLV
jgi:AcrR family transcriptional regulator